MILRECHQHHNHGRQLLTEHSYCHFSVIPRAAEPPRIFISYLAAWAARPASSGSSASGQLHVACTRPSSRVRGTEDRAASQLCGSYLVALDHLPVAAAALILGRRRAEIWVLTSVGTTSRSRRQRASAHSPSEARWECAPPRANDPPKAPPRSARAQGAIDSILASRRSQPKVALTGQASQPLREAAHITLTAPQLRSEELGS